MKTKKLLLSLLAALGFALMSFSAMPSFTTESVASQSIENIDYECKYGQCYGTAKSTGKRCKHCVSKKGDKYCYQHKR
jgi:hypothetical protein